jgi:uncharacterized protein YbjT (DUF2867 family)
MRSARIAMVDARDVAAVAVATLTAPGHAGHAYTLTGSAALSFADVAAILSTATGRAVTFHDQSPEARRAQVAASGLPPWHQGLRMEFWAVLSEGAASAVTDTVQAVTGAPPGTLARWAEEHAARFRHPGPA